MADVATRLEVENLHTYFADRRGVVRAVEGVSFTLHEGQTLALVGESGCGKSVTALSLARLLPCPPACHPHGRVLLEGKDVLRMSPRELIAVRGSRIAYVFQEPASALHPALTVGRQIMEALRLHRREADARSEALLLLRKVGMPDAERRLHSFPHELSGGMQQRAVTAMALACRPRVLVADEPTTALDVTIQAQILDLLVSLQSELGMAMVLISHNLGVVAETADVLHVMYAGRIVESGPTADVLAEPAHPYTQGLLAAVRSLSCRGRGAAGGRGRARGIPGTVPSASEKPAGCGFAPRCAHAMARCRREAPGIRVLDTDHCVRCWRYLT